MTYSAATDSYYVRPHEYESNSARYHDLFDFGNYDKAQVFSLETSDVSQSFELFDDETAFLDLIHYVLHRQGKQTIEVALADERLSPNLTYREKKSLLFNGKKNRKMSRFRTAKNIFAIWKSTGAILHLRILRCIKTFAKVIRQ